MNITNTQRKRSQDPKGKCAPCSAFEALGFPAVNLDWQRTPEPGGWGPAINSCWHSPWGRGGHAAVEAMPCCGQQDLPSCLLQSNTREGELPHRDLATAFLTPPQNKNSKWEQKHQENLKPVTAFKENLHRYYDLKEITMWLLYLEQLFGIAFAKSYRRDWRLI